jgi:NADP-reducing hydrogenase subunit HndB
MSKITSLADLNKRREELKNGLGIQVKAIDPENVVQVKVAMATCGIASGAKAIMEFFMEQLDRRKCCCCCNSDRLYGVLLCRTYN